MGNELPLLADSDELIAQGSRVMVPCLRIKEGVEVKWLYESKDIIQFLIRGSAKRFG